MDCELLDMDIYMMKIHLGLERWALDNLEDSNDYMPNINGISEAIVGEVLYNKTRYKRSEL